MSGPSEGPSRSGRPSRRLPRRLRTAASLLRRLAPRVAAVEDELDALPRLVAAGATCLDVGAKHGAYTLVLADAAGPEGHVVAFEPLPGPRRLLRTARRLLGGGTVETVAAAVAQEDGEGTIGLPVRRGVPVPGRAFLTSSADGLGSNAGWRHTAHATRVVTLDAWCAAADVAHVDLIKVDVEGAEQRVLAGAEHVLRRDRPTLLVELEDRHLGRFGTDARRVFDGLLARGYRAAVLAGDGWRRIGAPSRTRRNHLFWHPDGPHPTLRLTG